MIISVRGTSGAGKTHIVRAVTAGLVLEQDWCRPERPGKVLGSIYSGFPPLAVVGTYGTSHTGGCDTIKSRDLVFDMLREGAEGGSVLYEGLMESNEFQRTVRLARDHATHVIFLDVPLNVCLAAISERRAARGVTEPVNPRHTENKHAELGRVRFRLRQAGITTYHLDRTAALARVRELLEI